MSLEVSGMDEASRKLSAENIIKPANMGLARITLKLEALIKTATVVRTGRLRGSVNSVVGNGIALIQTSVEYAPYIEWGTSKMQSRHMEGYTKVLGYGGSFQYGVSILKTSGVLNDEEKAIAEGITFSVESG